MQMKGKESLRRKIDVAKFDNLFLNFADVVVEFLNRGVVRRIEFLS